LKLRSPEANDAGKVTKIRSEAVVILGSTPQSPSSSIALSNSFGLQSNLNFTEYDLFRKMMSSSSKSFEI
jgi:hypothetical protein